MLDQDLPLKEEKLDDDEFTFELISHRRLFQTLASLGSRLPSIDDADEEFGIDGLDDLIILIESHYSEKIEYARSLINDGKIHVLGLAELFHPGMLVQSHSGITG